MSNDCIRLRGARQNNLKGLNLDLPLRELIVVTGVSGSGKSSLAFDTIYAEGQRRYVETFSPYARQFLDRMDKPRADKIDGIPPAIAINQVNPVRTSRSTVGTMTELNDHLKLLFARAANLFCPQCGKAIRKETPTSIFEIWKAKYGPEHDGAPPYLLLTFPVMVPENFSEEEVREHLLKQGYTRIHRRRGATLEVVQDRVPNTSRRRARVIENIEAALKFGRGTVKLYPLRETGKTGLGLSFTTALRCPSCCIDFSDSVPHDFSFNSPAGACETCRGFGRTMGIDYGLVVPDDTKSLAEGAIKPWQTPSFIKHQLELLRFAKRKGIPTTVAWRDLSASQRQWVIGGDTSGKGSHWHGVQHFFRWLEGRSYRMHVRVMLSKYRAYRQCETCRGARLKAPSLWWRLGTASVARQTRTGMPPFAAEGVSVSPKRLATMPGLSFHEVMLLPLERCREFMERLTLPAPLDEATGLVLREIRGRLQYLVDVGLGYLTLDRQSRTLSGGEVQRINLTTALGTSLVNTLFVLDEPSIGLHTRDMSRMIRILHRLRDAGNSLLVVEHDPQVMRSADHILDLGPGPGEAGGHCQFFGTPKELQKNSDCITARCLRKEACTPGRKGTRSPRKDPPTMLEIIGAAENNLKNIDVALPLRRMVCITGVSGSGKSTLMETVLHRALLRAKHQPTETPGAHKKLLGHEKVKDAILIDQSPIGKSARSNPSSYVGALTAIRKVLSRTKLARDRGYTHGTFSFNSGMRCPACEGCGFEHVEMQFLSDVYLRCQECDGTRYRPELLEVTWPEHNPETGKAVKGLSISEILELTVTEALVFFEKEREIVRTLSPLQSVGLGYLRLGQPVPTLSGGEAQRLKLGAHLSKAGRDSGLLFLFDEPTTGLHMADIEVLIDAFRKLRDAGHSLIIIEHNLDVIRAADWIVDLGPEGGDQGGRVVCQGTVTTVLKRKRSHTAAALREEALPKRNLVPRVAESRPAFDASTCEPAIHIRNAREHNLKNITLRLPRDQFTVITGMSGSGKSTVAFDILFTEGQRRYLESLNAYARQFLEPAARPDVDAILGIPPTVAIEQRTSRGGRRSTVATQTEVYHFLRLLYVKLGVQYCPGCRVPIEPQSLASIQASIQSSFRGQKVHLLAPLIVARKGYYTDLAKWAAGKKFDRLLVDGEWSLTDPWPRLDRYKEHDIDLPVSLIKITPAREMALEELVASALAYGKGMIKVAPDRRGRPGHKILFSILRSCTSCGHSFSELDPRLFSFNSRHGWCPACEGTGLEGGRETETKPRSRKTHHHDMPITSPGEDVTAIRDQTCQQCRGARLNSNALAVLFRGKNLAEISSLAVTEAMEWITNLSCQGREKSIARDILQELRSRLRFLQNVGLGYITLDRPAPTLSGGEAQRIRLAAQLGSNLRGVCYILDEPTIGLHPRDNRMLLSTLQKLRKKGNTVIVVEHDEATMAKADHVIDLGPGAGRLGGRVVAEGTLDDIKAQHQSVTGRFLLNPPQHPHRPRREMKARSLRIRDARMHNLRGFDVDIPLGGLVCITGVSGSGKSTLVRRLLHDNLASFLSARRRHKGARADPAWVGCKEIEGADQVRRVLEVDQTPIGKTPRSCPATYVGFWNEVRKHFASLPESRVRGYTPGRFSFNVGGGRCDACEGQGVKKIAMSFLPDVKVPCEVCEGRRFTRETCDVLYKGKSIADVLAMPLEEAGPFFDAHPSIHHAVQLLQDIGLGYLTLGQPSPTLSGGEAQRIKLVTELAKAGTGPNQPRHRTSVLYVLDEPTVGLHMADVEKLTLVLQRLVDADNTVVVIEHNLDIMAEADWVIDLGPEGGDGGGQLVAYGPPETVGQAAAISHTARILSKFLRDRKPK